MKTADDPIRFSETPGSRERHLLRMHNNPLFPASKRNITQEAVDQARHDDLKEFEQFLDQFRQLLDEVASLQGRVESDVILKLKGRVDRMYDQCACFGFDSSEYKTGLKRLHDTIMATIKQAAEGDSVAMSELGKEQMARDLHLQLMEYKLVADLLREDSPVDEGDLVATLLSEQAETVQVVMTLFEPGQQSAIREEARTLVDRLMQKNELSGAVQGAWEAMSQQKQ